METKQIIENIESNLKFDMKVKLECIDVDGFFNETLLFGDLLNTSLTVKSMNKQFKILQFKDTHQTLSFKYLKYFRLKPKLNKVDVQNRLLKELLTAINKNKSINIIYMDDYIIKFKYNKHSIIEYDINDLLYEDDLNDAIEMIKSVYKPFIIKSKDDIAKLNCFCYGILTNGLRFEIIDIENTNENNRIWVWVSFTSEDSKPILLNFDTLLGAKIYPFKLSSDRIKNKEIKTRNNK